MVSRSAPSRTVLAALLLAFVAVFAFAGFARAEEAVILDNGALLRGSVIRENDREVVFRLDGIGSDSQVTIAKSRIAQRYVTRDPNASTSFATTSVPASSSEGTVGGTPTLASYVPSTHSPQPTILAPMLAHSPTLPDEEPNASGEDFFQRSARRAMLAFPKSAGLRAALVALAIAMLLALVEIGGRIVDIEALTLGKSTTLALLLGLLLTIDVLAADTLLRADLAPVLIIAELLAWVGCAAGVLRCGLAAAFQLLAFVLFAGSLVALVTGALLVTV